MVNNNNRLIPINELVALMRQAWANGDGYQTGVYAESLRRRGYDADITVDTLEVVVAPKQERYP